jgi:hypothetical protein
MATATDIPEWSYSPSTTFWGLVTPALAFTGRPTETIGLGVAICVPARGVGWQLGAA